jgi:hypothetical protein
MIAVLVGAQKHLGVLKPVLFAALSFHGLFSLRCVVVRKKSKVDANPQGLRLTKIAK